MWKKLHTFPFRDLKVENLLLDEKKNMKLIGELFSHWEYILWYNCIHTIAIDFADNAKLTGDDPAF